MYHVVLDTEILRQDPQRRSAASRRLQQLIGEGHVRVHIPDVVRREFLSGVAAEYRKHLKIVEEQLSPLRTDFLDEIAPNLRASVRKVRKDVVTIWQTDFDKWCRDSNVTIQPTPEAALSAIIAAYFDGTPPFRAPKSRSDFPDALIWATVRAIAAEFRHAHFVTRDDAFAQASTGIGSITYHSSLDAFLLSTYSELASRQDERIMALLLANLRILEREASDRLPAHLMGNLVESRKLPDGQGTVSHISGRTVSIRTVGGENLGGGYCRFPFTVQADILVEYALEISAWDAEDEDEGGRHEDTNEVTVDGVVTASGTLDVHVARVKSRAGYITNEQLRRAMHTASYEIADLEIESVEIE